MCCTMTGMSLRIFERPVCPLSHLPTFRPGVILSLIQFFQIEYDSLLKILSISCIHIYFAKVSIGKGNMIFEH